MPLDGQIRELAVGVTNGLTTDAEKARAIYDKVTGIMKYDKSGTGWGRGDALYACDAKGSPRVTTQNRVSGRPAAELLRVSIRRS